MTDKAYDGYSPAGGMQSVDRTSGIGISNGEATVAYVGHRPYPNPGCKSHAAMVLQEETKQSSRRTYQETDGS